MQKEEEKERDHARIRARERVLRDFEQSQSSFSLAKGKPTAEDGNPVNSNSQDSGLCINMSRSECSHLF